MTRSKITKGANAIDVLFGAKNEAQFRLRDFLVEEVSLVDRAANKRRFLVVKHRDTPASDPSDPPDPTPPKADPGANARFEKRLTLPSEAKEGILRSLTEALERVVAVSNAVRDAEETSEPSDQPTPDVLGVEINDISTMLAGILTRFPSPTAKTEEPPMLEQLKSIQAEIAKLVEAGDVDETQVAELRSKMDALLTGGDTDDTPALAKSLADLATVINGIAEAAKAGGDAKPTDEIKASVKRVHETLSTIVDKDLGMGGPALPSSLGTEVSDKLKVLASAMAQIAEAPDPFTLMEMSEKMLGIGKSLGEVADAVGETAPGPKTAGDGGREPTDKASPKKATARRLKTLGKLINDLQSLYRELGGGDASDKRAAEVTPQGPPDPSVGAMPPGDGKLADNSEPALAALMKRLDAIDTKVEQLAKTPEPPASRPEGGAPNPNPSPADNNGQRKRRGGPWIW